MKKRILSVLLICLVLMQTAMAYGRINVDQDASLVISHVHPGVSVRIYRMVDVSETVRFTLCGDFARYGDLQPKIDLGAWDEIAQILDTRVVRDNIRPTASGVTGADGVASFTGLKPGLYLVMGDAYRMGDTVYYLKTTVVSVPGLKADDSWDYNVLMIPKYSGEKIPEKTETNISVQKIWQDEGGRDQRPATVTVQLLQGDTVVDTVILSADHNWRHSWSKLPAGYQYRVVETDVADGYTDSYVRDGDTVIIVNTYTPDEPPPPDNPPPPEEPEPPDDSEIFDIPDDEVPLDKPTLPQTGQLWWPVSLLAAAGLALILVGLIRRRGAADEE